MKILRINFALLYVLGFLVIAGLLSSCEQEILPEAEEGFKSTTNNSGTVDLIDENAVVERPLMHKRYSNDISKAEMENQWEDDVADYFRDNPKTEDHHRGVSTEWFYNLCTHTGTQTGNDTDAPVYSKVTFKVNVGTWYHGWVKLDNPGNDREKGDWDCYLMRSAVSGQAVSWVEASKAQLALKGTDSWFPTHLNVYVRPAYQSIGSTGNSQIYATPNVILDNASSNSWDYYSTGNIGYGRLNF